MYAVIAASKLLDATSAKLKNQIGKQAPNRRSFSWAESKEDAIGQCMANVLSDQTNLKIISISENKLTFSAECPVSWTEPNKSVNTVEITYTATPIQ